jgi:hypothetical protein
MEAELSVCGMRTATVTLEKRPMKSNSLSDVSSTTLATEKKLRIFFIVREL